MSALAERKVELPDQVRAQMEQSMGYNFSKVQMKESEAATQMNANAFAKGNVITFAPGKFNPMTAKGRQLIGHELAHVVQNTQKGVQGDITIGGEEVSLSSAYESEADRLGAKAAQFEGEMASEQEADLQMADASSSSVMQGSFFEDLWGGLKDQGGKAFGSIGDIFSNKAVGLGLNAAGIFSGVKGLKEGIGKKDKGVMDWIKLIGSGLSLGGALLGGIGNVSDIKDKGADTGATP